MEKMISLNDLLKHEVMDLYSAEEQIIEALPAMIEKAKNTNLKKALQEHLKITEQQKKRLDKVQQLMDDNKGDEESQSGDEKKGFFSRLFNGSNGKEKCKGMEGLIDEGQKIMSEDISPEALDAAIIASAQKIEHYEISGYGTAKAYAGELKLNEVQNLLQETLDEEYEADDRLTELALKRINLDAEKADGAGIKNKQGKEGAGEQPGRNKTSEKKSKPEEQRSPGEKSSASSGKNGRSKKENSPGKAKATKSAASKQKPGNRSGGPKNKKSASKETQSKTKKAGSKRKASAR
jgi:ferritin-like metal-binding protein YciE